MGYARWWRAGWSLAAAVGVGFAVLTMSPLPALLALVLLSACTGTAQEVWGAAHSPSSSAAGRRPPAARLVSALGSGCALLAALTLIAGSAALALLTALLALVTCPAAVRLCRRRTRGESAAPRPDRAPSAAEATEESVTTADVVAVIGGLPERDLCVLWRSTFWELSKPHTAEQRLTLVLVRQVCLDEIGRRDPAALRAWLASGARASVGPDRFLAPPDAGAHDAA